MMIIAEFRHMIAPAFPGLVNLLQDSYPEVRQAVAAALLQFLEQGALIHPFF
jgi:HEAT repeat